MLYNMDFLLDGVSAKSVGIIMQHEPAFSPIEANIETFDVPGRTGSLHVYSNTYKDRTVTVDCYCVQYDGEVRDHEDYNGQGVYSKIQAIENFLFPPPSDGADVVPYRKLQFTPWLNNNNSSNYYYEAYVLNGLEVQARLCTLAPFSVSFLINPKPRSDD